MAWTYHNSARAAALNGIVDLLDGGKAHLLATGDAELAAPTFGSPAFGNASSAAPSVATANTMMADASVTAGTIVKVQFKSAATGTPTIKGGSVGTTGADFIVTDNVIPSGATSVNLTNVQFSLTLGGS